jgi:TonB family protein
MPPLRLASVLLLALATPLVACTSSTPTRTTGSTPRAYSDANRPAFSPDSLVLRLDSVFFRSDSPHRAVQADDRPPAPLDAEVVGRIEQGRLRWSLHLSTTVQGKGRLTPNRAVAVRSDSMMMLRGDAWRVPSRKGDHVVVRRGVILAASDVGRLRRSDLLQIELNGRTYRLPDRLRADLDRLVADTPDSLHADTTGVTDLGTAYAESSTQTPPEGDEKSVLRVLRTLDYPEEAKRQGIQGVVQVQFVVLPTGSTAHIRVVRGVHPLLDVAALDAIAETRFQPGRVNGKAVPTWLTLPVTFRSR